MTLLCPGCCVLQLCIAARLLLGPQIFRLRVLRHQPFVMLQRQLRRQGSRELCLLPCISSRAVARFPEAAPPARYRLVTLLHGPTSTSARVRSQCKQIDEVEDF